MGKVYGQQIAFRVRYEVLGFFISRFELCYGNKSSKYSYCTDNKKKRFQTNCLNAIQEKISTNVLIPLNTLGEVLTDLLKR